MTIALVESTMTIVESAIALVESTMALLESAIALVESSICRLHVVTMAISTIPYVRHNETLTIPLTVSLTMPFTVSLAIELAIALSVTLSIMSLPVPLVVSFLEEEEGVRACLRAGVWVRRNECDHEEDEGEDEGKGGLGSVEECKRECL